MATISAVATKPKAEEGAFKPKERIGTFAEDLQKFGTPREKALDPRLGEMRITEEDGQESDDDSVASRQGGTRGGGAY